jgi:hypothetical protein
MTSRGLAFACATSSRRFMAEFFSEPPITNWVAITIVTGSKSLIGSNGSVL